MRDPTRIPEMLDLLRQLWEKHPDWRFGQLVFNTFDGIWDTSEPRFFNVEDDVSSVVLLRRLEYGYP